MDVLDRADLPFPHSLPEFQRLFPDDAACAAYLEKARLRGRKRLDAHTKSGRRATEVERSGSHAGLNAAAQRRKKSGAPQKELQVPLQDMGNAAKGMRKVGIGGTARNMGASKRWRVRPPGK